MPKKSKVPNEPLEIKGIVLDNETRKVTRIGTSNHVSIPAWWKRLFCTPIVEISLIRDEDGETCILISKPKKEAVPSDDKRRST